MVIRGRFLKLNFTNVEEIPEGLLKMSQMGFHCVCWMEFTTYGVPLSQINMANREKLLFTIAFYGKASTTHCFAYNSKVVKDFFLWFFAFIKGSRGQFLEQKFLSNTTLFKRW